MWEGRVTFSCRPFNRPGRMQLAPAFLSLIVLFSGALACPDEAGHHHEHIKREFPSTKLSPPTRPLVWGDVNIIHTTDSHGWLLGHQKTSFPEPNYRLDGLHVRLKDIHLLVTIVAISGISHLLFRT